MAEFRIPTTPEEWAAVEPNKTDWSVTASIFAAADMPKGSVADPDKIAAAARLLERERCVAALATHLFDGAESMSVAQAEARRILTGEV